MYLACGNLTRFGMFHLAPNLKGARIVDEIKRSKGDDKIFPEAFFFNLLFASTLQPYSSMNHILARTMTQSV